MIADLDGDANHHYLLIPCTAILYNCVESFDDYCDFYAQCFLDTHFANGGNSPTIDDTICYLYQLLLLWRQGDGGMRLGLVDT